MKELKTFARLEARVDPEAKALWQEAAELMGISLTDFVVATMTESARETIEAYCTMKLNKEDTKAFVEAMINPTRPNEAMLAAAAEHKRVFK